MVNETLSEKSSMLILYEHFMTKPTPEKTGWHQILTWSENSAKICQRDLFSSLCEIFIFKRIFSYNFSSKVEMRQLAWTRLGGGRFLLTSEGKVAAGRCNWTWAIIEHIPLLLSSDSPYAEFQVSYSSKKHELKHKEDEGHSQAKQPDAWLLLQSCFVSIRATFHF